MARPLEGLAIALQSRSEDSRVRERCFRAIWAQYYPRLVVFVRGFGGATVQDAEDVVQEIMERVFRSITTYDPAWSFSTWVYAIARNACRDRARREGRAPAERVLSELPASAEPSHSVTPESELLREEVERRIGRFFAEADPGTRQLAFLRFHERMRCRQIAEVMDVPVGTVKFRIHEVRRKLRRCLEEEHGEDRALGAQVL